MPTPRVPTAIHEARGNYKKNPARAKAREHEPVVTDPIGGYPETFKDTSGFASTERTRLRGIWDELIADAAPGVLNRSHRMHLEATARLMYRVRFGSPKTGDYANLGKFLTQMGMNPAAQSTVSGGGFTPPGSATPIGSLAARAAARTQARTG